MLQVGIVGLPNVGKSTLFNALTKGSALAANYPFATIEPNVGIVNVPDPRLTRLAEIYQTGNIITATVRFVDIAGLVAGASKGEGLGNQFLAHIRSTSLIIEVVRAFKNDSVTRVNQSAGPKQDIAVIMTELALADLETVKRRQPQLEKEVKADRKLASKLERLNETERLLENGRPVYHNLDPEDLKDLSDLQLLTAKPIIYVFNLDEDSLSDVARQKELSSLVSPAPALFISAKLESELATLEDYDARELRESYDVSQSGLEALIVSAYKTLGLQSFLTAGEKEVRAWTVPIGATAPVAAAEIHSDIQRGFIAAEIVSFSDLDQLGSLSACRSAGKVRTEGKTYVMQPDDVVEFKFNV